MKTGSFFQTIGLPGRISIARSAPRRPVDMTGLATYRQLNPTQAMMKMGYAQYRTLYFRTILGPLDPREVWDDLHRLAGGAEPILLCWENLKKPDEWCHRTMVAQWFGEHLGEEVVETSVSKSAPPASPQRSFDFLVR